MCSLPSSILVIKKDMFGELVKNTVKNITVVPKRQVFPKLGEEGWEEGEEVEGKQTQKKP